MQQLIPVVESENEVLVNGRDLHDFLEVKERYPQWFDRMVGYGFEEDVDYIGFTEKSDKPNGGRPTVEHHMKIDMAKEISMLQRTDKGKEARRYFIAVEKEYKNNKPDLSDLLKDPFAALTLMFEATSQTKESVEEVKGRVINLEENLPLTPSEYGYINKRVSQRIHQIGRERSYSMNKQQKSELFKAIGREIKEVTGTRIRSQLKAKQFDEVVAFIDDWEPSSSTRHIVNQMELLEEEA